MKDASKKSSFFFRVNLLDVVLVLLVILCIVGIFQRANLRALFENSEEQESFTVTFEARCVRSTTVNTLTKDTVFYVMDGDTRVTLGSLSDISGSVATVYLQDKDGETVKAVYPKDTYYDVTGTLLCRGISNDGSFLAGGKTYLAANQTLCAYTEQADIEIIITSIAKTE